MLFFVLLLALFSSTKSQEDFRPCSEISRELRFPCLCSLGEPEAALDGNPAISVNCDKIVFSGDLPAFPYGAPIVSFSQRFVGHQALPTQVFTSSALPLRSIDLSGNSLRRLTDRLLQGLQASLVELKLADNLLGDTLNPIFSSSEFHGLNHLQSLDLSGNQLKALEEGIFEGCKNLQNLFLERNSLSLVPGSSLNGPKALKLLSLKENRIESLKHGAFQAQSNLEKIDLSNNLIGNVEGGAFVGLAKLRVLNLGRNRLSRFNSDVFQGAEGVSSLDLSQNFIVEFPSVALNAFQGINSLNLSQNLIQSLDNKNLEGLTNLVSLDLSRNNIAFIVPGTFLGLKKLRKLDISINSLRQIEDDSFEGLDNLEFLNLKDNNILLIPASALGRLPHLQELQLNYNRITALSGDILQSISKKISKLILSNNVVRELPASSFQHFSQLQILDLSGNLLNNFHKDSFRGLNNSLLTLVLSQNRLVNLPELSLSLSNLQNLDLSLNDLTELNANSLANLPQLKSLNLSSNYNLSLSNNLFKKLVSLQTIDLSFTKLKSFSSELFGSNRKLQKIVLKHASLSELSEGSFNTLPNLTEIDLSFNSLLNIKQSAFINVMNLKALNLRGNQLSSFKGEFFNTGTSLEFLDLSFNQLSYLFPSSFRIHPRLQRIDASNNKFNFFPAELISSLQFLQEIDLSSNQLKSVEELDFARLPRLRRLNLRRNNLESLSEMSFHNSTQLQIIDLGFNKLERLGERTFEGLVRMEWLNLESNLLTELPETIFERARLQMLENINLQDNLFEVAPWKALQKQYFFISFVGLARNKLKEIPGDDSIMVNIKKLDLSFNPLSEQALENVLGEPKTVRELNLAGTGIKNVVNLETPFLKSLNLSFNNITKLSDKTLERTSLLESLDLSQNKIKNLEDLSGVWGLLRNLQSLDLSSNPIETISNNNFQRLSSLRELSIKNLEFCSKIEKNIFKNVPNLSKLSAFGYPKLGYMDLKGLLSNLIALQEVNIESKDPAIGSDQLQAVLTPRTQVLGLHGSRLRTISSGTLSGLKGSPLLIRFVNSSLNNLPPALFFPVPRSSKITLELTGSQITKLTPQILMSLKDRRGDLMLKGLETNPLSCDCSARALKRFLPKYLSKIRCASPHHLVNRLLVELTEEDLSCDQRKLTTSSSTTPGITRTRPQLKTTEPEIIWSLPATEKTKLKNNQVKTQQASLNNDDTLIIGIVGGVVALIAIFIIIICIIRLRMTGNQYRGGPLALGPLQGPGSSCACSVKGAPPVYAPNYAATLPHKMSQQQQGSILRASNYSTMGRVPYYSATPQPPQPYFIAFPQEEKVYR